MQIAEPITYKNLSIFLLRDNPGTRPAPQTLDEALQSGTVEVKETGNIDELTILNKGDHEVFIQTGDIVKGGKQDRIIKVSTVLKPGTGEFPLETLCVESGRWGKRSDDEEHRFSRSRSSSDKKMRLLSLASHHGSTGKMRKLAALHSQEAAQTEMWDKVREKQSYYEEKANEEFYGSSPTSYEQTENSAPIKELKKEYQEGLKETDIEHEENVGVVFVVNGRVHSGEVYESHTLFRKMWDKNLEATISDALCEELSGNSSVPQSDHIESAMSDVLGGEVSEIQLPTGSWVKNFTTDEAMLAEAQRENRIWVHRHYTTAETPTY